MKKTCFALCVMSCLFTACIDGTYDLSNIDTSAKIEVKDLVVPLNLDDIKLKSILDFGDNSQIKEIDGVYAFVDSGTFVSDMNVGVAPIVIKKPSVDMDDSKVTVDFPAVVNIPDEIVKQASNYTVADLQSSGFLNDDDILISFGVPETVCKEIELVNNDVDEAIVSLKEVKFAPVNVSIYVAFPELKDIIGICNVSDAVINLPKGIESTDSHYVDGALKYDVITGEHGVFSLTTSMYGIDFKKAEADGATFKDHKFTYNKKCSVGGWVNIRVKDIKQSATLASVLALEKITYDCKVRFDSDIVITEFSGGIKYDLEKINVNGLDLSDLPDMLSETGTKISLSDPQLYLHVDNPVVAKYPNSGIVPKVDLSLYPYPAGNDTYKASFSLGKARNLFCLSPNEHTTYYGTKDRCEYIPFANLGNILSSQSENGESCVPKLVDVDVAASIVQDVENFILDSDYGKVRGGYVFYTPLDMTPDSRFIYVNVTDGWNSADLDAMTIEDMHVTGAVSTDVPYDIKMTVVPLDKQGNVMSGVECEDVIIPAKAKGHKSEYVIKGPVKYIDGIKVIATETTESGGPLKPDMTIKVENLRIKVNGYYEKEL